MTTKRSLERRLDDTSDIVLGNLETEDRLRFFIQEAAEGREDRIKRLTETAPSHQYTATDFEYTDGIKQLVMLSLLARHQLQQNYLAITDHETTRDKYIGLMLLNEALSRLSRAFDIDEYGAVDVPDRDGAQDESIDPDTAYLGDKYRELWESISADLLLDEEERSIPYFSNLAAGGLMAYPADYSAEAFDDLDIDRVPSEVHLSELRLLTALVDLYINFHGWRLFAEDYLDVSLDEFLGVSIPGSGDDTAALSVSEIDEQLCRNILSLKEDYLEAYPSLLDEWFEDDEINPDLAARAQAYADDLAEDSGITL